MNRQEGRGEMLATRAWSCRSDAGDCQSVEEEANTQEQEEVPTCHVTGRRGVVGAVGTLVRSAYLQTVPIMDQISIKKPNPKYRLNRCLEFIEWRYSMSCWYFLPLL